MDNVDITVEPWNDRNVIDAEEDEIEMTIDGELSEPRSIGIHTVKDMHMISPIKPINISVNLASPKTPPRIPRKEFPISQKLNISTATAETEAPSFDEELNTPTSRAMAMIAASISMDTSTSLLPNELFSDALDHLSDLAVAAGIVSEPSHKKSPERYATKTPVDNARKNMDNVTTALFTNGEEPGHILSAATEDSPFDEAPMDEAILGASMDEAILGAPMDEAILGGKRNGEMSAIARMRYLKAMGIATPERISLATKVTKSHEEIQKEKHEKWRNMKAQATQQEAAYMRIEPKNIGKTSVASSNVLPSPKRGRSRKSSKEEEDIDISTSIFDLSMLTKPLESAQAAIIGAFMGGDSDEDDDDDEYSCASSYYDDGDGDGDDDSESLHSSRNEHGGERKARSQTQKRSNVNAVTRDSPSRKRNEWDFEEEPDHDLDSAEEFEPEVERINQSGFNKSFLEVSCKY